MNYISEFAGYIFGAGGILAWFFERRNKKADLLDKYQLIYDKWVDDYMQKKEMSESLLNEKIKHLEKVFKQLEESHAKIVLEHSVVLESARAWEDAYKDLSKKYDEVVKDNKRLHQEIQKLKNDRKNQS